MVVAMMTVMMPVEVVMMMVVEPRRRDHGEGDPGRPHRFLEGEGSERCGQSRDHGDEGVEDDLLQIEVGWVFGCEVMVHCRDGRT
jgi:hypothetical protein